MPCAQWRNWLPRPAEAETAVTHLIAQAELLVWELGLRGYDTVDLAAALAWQEEMSQPITLATFDRQLWTAAQDGGLAVFPEDLP